MSGAVVSGVYACGEREREREGEREVEGHRPSRQQFVRMFALKMTSNA